MAAVFFAFLILSVSLIKSAAVNYAFNGETRKLSQTTYPSGTDGQVLIDYSLPHPGKISPDNSLWFFKVARDRIWFWLTTSGSRKAELSLLFADKRLGSAKILFEKGKAELGFSTLSKGEKYLELAAKTLEENTKKGMDTTEFARTLSTAALKHKEVTEKIKEIAPEDAKPKINEIENYAEDVYKISRDILRSQGQDAPESPFDWD